MKPVDGLFTPQHQAKETTYLHLVDFSETKTLAFAN